MRATSTVEPVGIRSTKSGRLTEHIAVGPDMDLQDYIVVCLGAVGSENPHCVAVRDVGLRMRLDASTLSPGVVTYVLHQPPDLIWDPALANPHRSYGSGLGLSHIKSVPQPDFETSSSEVNQPWWVFETPNMAGSVAQLETTRHPVVQEFALGIDGVLPSRDVVATAACIVVAALERTTEPEFSVDDDGSLSFDLRLSNGLRLLAELPIDGTLDVGVYDDGDANQRVREVEYLPSATAEELIDLL